MKDRAKKKKKQKQNQSQEKIGGKSCKLFIVVSIDKLLGGVVVLLNGKKIRWMIIFNLNYEENLVKANKKLKLEWTQLNNSVINSFQFIRIYLQVQYYYF